MSEASPLLPFLRSAPLLSAHLVAPPGLDDAKLPPDLRVLRNGAVAALTVAYVLDHTRLPVPEAVATAARTFAQQRGIDLRALSGRTERFALLKEFLPSLDELAARSVCAYRWLRELLQVLYLGLDSHTATDAGQPHLAELEYELHCSGAGEVCIAGITYPSALAACYSIARGDCRPDWESDPQPLPLLVTRATGEARAALAAREARQQTAAADEVADCPLSVRGGDGAAERQTRGTVNQRMMEQLLHDPERCHWSQREWADFLGCTPAAVAKTLAWRSVKAARALEAASRVPPTGSRRR